MLEVAVVGAGVAAAGVCCALEAADVDAEVTVREGADVVGGRAATLHRGDRRIDYGANYLKDEDERVTALVREVAGTDGLVDVQEPVYTFDREGTVSEGRDADDRKWTYRDGIDALPRRLLRATDATVRSGSPVTALERTPNTADAGSWTLRGQAGSHLGEYDVVVLTPAAPETAPLLGSVGERDGPWSEDLVSAATELADAVAAVPFRPIYAAVLCYERALERPYYALVNTDREHAVGWISREECKPGHVPAGESVLVVQASPQWTREHADLDRDEAPARLADHAAAVIGEEWLADPDWRWGTRFGAALPDAGLEDAAAEAGVALEDCRATLRGHGCFLAGDWVAGEGRLHAALRSGLETGDRVAAALGDAD